MDEKKETKRERFLRVAEAGPFAYPSPRRNRTKFYARIEKIHNCVTFVCVLMCYLTGADKKQSKKTKKHKTGGKHNEHG